MAIGFVNSRKDAKRLSFCLACVATDPRKKDSSHSLHSNCALLNWSLRCFSGGIRECLVGYSEVFGGIRGMFRGIRVFGV